MPLNPYDNTRGQLALNSKLYSTLPLVISTITFFGQPVESKTSFYCCLYSNFNFKISLTKSLSQLIHTTLMNCDRLEGKGSQLYIMLWIVDLLLREFLLTAPNGDKNCAQPTVICAQNDNGLRPALGMLRSRWENSPNNDLTHSRIECTMQKRKMAMSNGPMHPTKPNFTQQSWLGQYH